MASSDYDNSDDPRDIELSSLTAIYPEIQRVRPDDRHTIALDIPVTPSTAVVVFFPAPEAQENAGANAGQVDSHELAHLPSLHLEVAFGPEYPADQPPKVTLSTTPPWLPAETLRKLQDDAPRLWEEMGRDMVGFTYIDHVQQSAEDAFGLVGGGGGLEVDPQHKIAILDYDIKARQAAFDRETFECGVCLDPKKGAVCHRMLDCGHVFCVECLKDCYNKAIEEGDLAAVRCLEPSCAKEREKAGDSSKKRKKPRTYISPSELLQIPLEPAMVKRYVTLKYKNELESDKNTIYCPRSWCNGAARSKKHKKPEGLELAEASDDEDEAEESNVGPDGKPKPFEAKDRLAICEDCSFAFCSRCLQSWHGEFFLCVPPNKKEELTAEEKASAEYITLHSTPCPTCAVPAQKMHGCNHMICFRCNTHFCYLCSAWLDPMNPYRHFNVQPNGKVTGCYNRLWELEGGDGEGVGYGFDEGFRGDAPLMEVDEVEAQAGDLDQMIQGDAPAPQAPELLREEAPPRGGLVAGQVDIAREGPLVLRIAANQPARGGAGGGGHGDIQGHAAVQPARGGNQHAAGGHEGHDGEGERGQAPGGGGPGAGNRAAGRGRGGGGRGPHRQNNQRNQVGQGRRRNNINNQNNRNAGPQDVEVEGGGLDAAQQAWIRQFVQLALNDEEDGDDFDIAV
jgi:E3 ubiquitin-protein ligase RNF14